ncbi:helix-turn-helix domain-containing protein [Actomonas aquatica]|uniref:Helix-turn-helix domain-containing protein n=1 Tax=Actomonas aquatica TaxID=2866162 RepID=A0ABZ1CDE5_9BACT|nr:helix-turn-helix domain-containing protein [Opitutus sp. WL0086]WRQ89616.1 helix-turn-helix domain-containing protein [Opitutus sp. WL0086]
MLETSPFAPEPEHGARVVARLQESSLFLQYQADFEEATGLPLALRAVGITQPLLNNSTRANPFCILLAAHNPSCTACRELQLRFDRESVHEPLMLEGFAGIAEAAAPVRLGDEVIAHLETGQVLLHNPTEKRFLQVLRQAQELGLQVDPAKLKSAYFGTRVLRRKHFESIVRLMNIFAQHLGVVSNQIAVQEHEDEPPAVKRARAFVAEHLDEELNLSRIARASNMSEFYFCKVFKKATGMTFTHFLACQRVERVKQDLLNPHIRVSESAFAHGFQSLSQFNRVFRRIAGESPSSYRERVLRHSA